MQNFFTSPRTMVACYWRNRHLIHALVEREVLGRYKGSIFGVLWSFFNPLLMLSIYTFVFSVVFKARWNVFSDSKFEFALVLFSGLIMFNFFSECATKAPGLILANINYVKKVVFPVEILPLVLVGSAFFHMLISLSVWLLTYVFFIGTPHKSILLMPFVMISLVLFTAGVTWFLSALGVYLRDVSQLIGTAITVLMFLTPIFYPISSLPKAYRVYLELNPLALVIELARKVLYFGEIPGFFEFLILLLGSLTVAYAGFLWFQKSKKGFADVL